MFPFSTVLVLIHLFIIISPIFGIRRNDTCLPKLSMQINRTLSKPWGTSDQLFRDIFVYFEELEGIRRDIKKGLEEGFDPKNDLSSQVKKYQEVNETGGPLHLQSNVIIRPLIDFYKWNRENIEELYELLQFTRETWKKLRLILDGGERPKSLLTVQEKIKQRLQNNKF